MNTILRSLVGRLQGKAGLALLLFFLGMMGFGASGIAQEQVEPAKNVEVEPQTYWLLVEPGYLEGEMRRLVGGGQGTMMVPARLLADGEVEEYGQDEFTKLRVGWKSFRERTGEAVDGFIEKVEPRVARDDKGEAVFAELVFDSPIASGVLFASSLIKKMEAVLGKDLLVVVPNRSQCFIFPNRPELVGHYGEALRDLFEEAIYPVSREVFLIQAGEMPRAIGLLGE